MIYSKHAAHISMTVILGIFFIWPGNLFSLDETSALTLRQCLSLADRQSELLKIQYEKQFQSRESVAQSWGGILPDIRFKYSRLYRDTNETSSSGESSDSSFALSQPLFYGFRKVLAISAAKNEQQKQELEYLSLKRELRAVVAETFYTIAQSEADLSNIRNTARLMGERMKELHERVRLGKSRESEVLAVESQIAAFFAQEKKIEGDKAKAVEELSFLTGLEPSLVAINDDALPIEEAQPLEEILISALSRSDLQILKKDESSQKLKALIARGAFLPTLGLDGSWYIQRSGSLSGVDWDAALSVDFPLFSGGITRSRLREELSKLKESQFRVELLTRQVKAEVRIFHDALVSSIAQLKALRDSHAKAEKSYQMQLKDYRFGMVNNLDVISATMTLLNAKQSLDRALIQVKMDRALLLISAELFEQN